MTGQTKLPLCADLIRLRDIDHRLRGEGINVPDLAVELDVTERTIHRMLNVLRDLVGATEIKKQLPVDGGRDGVKYLQKYSGRPKQFFAKFRD